MSMTRRLLLAAAATALTATAAVAQDWKARFPEIVFAVVPAENASGVTQRYQPLMEYLAKELGVKMTLRVAADYAAVIEGQKAGNIHIAEYGPSSYVRAWTVTNGGVEPFVSPLDANGVTGYFAVAYAKSTAAGAKLEDFKGKNLCLVDPNSTSGNNVPLYSMSKMGIETDKFFAKVTNAGSHENAVMAVQQGTCDLAFNWWNSENDSNLSRMVNKGMVKKEDFKIVFRSDRIPGSPFAFLTSMPAEMRGAIRKAFLDMPTKSSETLNKMTDGKSTGFGEMKHADYQVTIDLQKFVDDLRKKRGS